MQHQDSPWLPRLQQWAGWLWRHWRIRAAATPRLLWAKTLLFVNPDGSPYCTDDVADIGREYARAAGWSEAAVATVGGKCWRIGGATDLRALCQSAAEAERVLKRRGRWSSDIGEIYARTTIEEGAAYSAAIGDAASTDLERLGSGAGWAEPAARF